MRKVMVLLQIIGTISAIAFLILFRGKKKQPPKNVLQEVVIETDHGQESVQDFLNRTDEEERRAEPRKEPWYVEHTDDLFGRPVNIQNDHYFHVARLAPDKTKLHNEYDVPFQFSKNGRVRVRTDEFPLDNQKLVFEWITGNMDSLAQQIIKSISQSCGDWLSQEEMMTSFRPDLIRRIALEGSIPVSWTISFDSEHGEGEAYTGVARGKDQNLNDVDFGYL